MNTVVLRRRLVYICAMVLLLVPLYFLGAPSVRRTDGSVIDEGGALSRLRTEYDLGQSDLGEMDPASESMRLATLGLRGVAATILWQKAEFYKREEYWDRLSATLNQIAVLQPHFVKVWEFQAHNLSYNVSVEFDDYRQRYAWVKRGMDYLIKGSKFNKNRTEMPFELGWFFGNKLGVADEKKQYRELFRNDTDFHNEVYERAGLDFTQAAGLGPDGKPDNWRAGALWYRRGYDMVDAGARPARSTMMFYRMAPLWDMKHAEGIQADGYLDDPARVAWERCEKSWEFFGNRQIQTSFGDFIYLNELKKANQQAREAQEEFYEYCGETYDRIYAERKSRLSPEQIAILEKDELDRTFDEVMELGQVSSILDIPPSELANAVPEEQRVEAIHMANELYNLQQKISHIEVYRQQINFGYWAARAKAEQTDSSLRARTNMYEANQLLDRGELDAALEKFEVAWQAWSDLFNEYPSMMIDDVAEDVIQSVDRYRRLLDQPDLPTDFALHNFLTFRTVYEQEMADFAMMSVIADWPERYPGRNFLEEMLDKSMLDRKAQAMADSATNPDESALNLGPDVISAPGGGEVDVLPIIPGNGAPVVNPPEEAAAGEDEAGDDEAMESTEEAASADSTPAEPTSEEPAEATEPTGEEPAAAEPKPADPSEPEPVEPEPATGDE